MPCRLEFTDARFVFAGKSYPDIPLLADSQNRLVAPVCDYLRYLVIYDHLRTTSVKTYAEYIASFWKFLEGNRLDFREIVDLHLIQWLNKQEANGVSTPTSTARCDAIFDFYVWLEWKGYVHQMIRIPGWNDSDKFIPRLTAVPTKGLNKQRRSSKFGIVSAVRPRGSNRAKQPTPVSEEVSRIYIAADNVDSPGITERNHLLIDWYTQVGVRRMEWRSLTKNQIPDWPTIVSLHQHHQSHQVPLVITKGGRTRHVGVLPELLEKTREYIEGHRNKVVTRFRQKQGKSYKEPEEIFLSEKTGQPLVLKGITNLLTGLFKEADVKGRGHRLRATYLTSLFHAEIEAEELRIAENPETKMQVDLDMILHKVAEIAGHANPESLRDYLTFVRKQRARNPNVRDAVTLRQQLESRRHELAVLEHRIKQQREALEDLASTKRSLLNQ